MKRYLYIGLLVIAVACFSACVAIFFYKTKSAPQHFDTIGSFGGVSLRIEYATTTEARERGLGGRESLLNDYGMLFIFADDEKYGFWMKDMLVPIDIFWLDNKGQVISMAEDVSPATYPNVFYPIAPARYVLETVAGFADKNNIATGTPLSLKNLESVLK